MPMRCSTGWPRIPKYVMRRPMMLPQLLRAVHDKKSTQHQLANIFARDPALAGNLLKVANSPVYRVSEDPVESLDRAVAHAGHRRSAFADRHGTGAAGLQTGRDPLPALPGDRLGAHLPRRQCGREPRLAGGEFMIRSPRSCWRSPWGWAPSSSIGSSLIAPRPCSTAITPHPAVIISLIDSQCAGVAKRVAASWDLSERVLTALEEQRPRGIGQPGAPPSPLGRSLAFGRKLAALAVLFEHGRISEDTVRASMVLERSAGGTVRQHLGQTHRPRRARSDVTAAQAASLGLAVRSASRTLSLLNPWKAVDSERVR